jgi:hypothetical protein
MPFVLACSASAAPRPEDSDALFVLDTQITITIVFIEVFINFSVLIFLVSRPSHSLKVFKMRIHQIILICVSPT